MKFFFKIAVLAGLMACAAARADFAADVARVHLEAIGGREQVAALKALKATGVTKIRGGELPFVMWAARPRFIRLETTSGGRVLTQGYDGVNAPWLLDSATGVVREMGSEAARMFATDADFDDPLVFRGPPRQIALDYQGEAEVDGKPAFKLLVTENFTELFTVYVDRETYHLVRRDVVKPGRNGPETVETDYGDFREVSGVMLPHRVVEKVGGVVRSETVMTKMEGNPPLMMALFSRPAGVPVKP